jgi:hypothetical protein
MKNGKVLGRSGKFMSLTLAIASLWSAAGCDQLGGVLTLVQATALSAVQESAEGVIQDAVGGLFGNIIPNAD